MEWLPIETAPKDKAILLWGSYSYTIGAYYCTVWEGEWDHEESCWTTPIGSGYGSVAKWAVLERPCDGPFSFRRKWDMKAGRNVDIWQ